MLITWVRGSHWHIVTVSFTDCEDLFNAIMIRAFIWENTVKIRSQKTHLFIIWVNVKKSQKHTQLYGLWIQVLPSFLR